MKTFQLLMIALVALILGSCIRKEPLNAECDIITASMPDNILNRAPIIENDKVIFIVKKDAKINALSPEFTLTPGATIEPPSGTTLDFTTPQHYTVTSQDRHWEKTYTVEVQINNIINLDYNFEHVRTVKPVTGGDYDVFYELGPDGKEVMTWSSGNAGFALTFLGKTPDSYPTYQLNNGKSGKCAAMTTRSTGTFGAMFNKPLAAGNLFIGKFDPSNAPSKPLESTKFGTPFVNIPRFLRGYYKYTPGEKYCRSNDAGKLEEVPGKTDKFNIYAVFFEAVPGMEMLDGTNVLSPDNPNIVAVAEISDDKRVPATEWTEFYIPFVYRTGKEIDPQKLIDGKYSITIVFSSSIDGDYFSGAIGSTLLVDEVSLLCLEQDDL